MQADSIIGAVPEHWAIATLGAVANKTGGDIQTGPFGSQLHASDYVDAGVPSIMPKNIGDNRVEIDEIARITEEDATRLQRYRVRPGDIVYSRRGDVEKRALIRDAENGWLCGTGCLRVRFGDDTVSPEYISYYLGHPAVRSWIVRHAHGATMPNLNTSILSELPVILPLIEEQRAIAHVLGTLDDKIELNRQMNQTLDEIARTLFRSWFVDFDPVRAKAEGRQPDGMDAETAALFPDRIVDSDLGPIPEGWEIKSIGECLELRYGKALKADIRQPGYAVVMGSNGPVGSHSESLASGPGIVVGRKGNPGTVHWVEDNFWPIDTAFYVVPLDSNRSLHWWYFALIEQNLGRLQADSAVPGLNRSAALMTKQVIPCEGIQEKFVSTAAPLFDLIAANKREAATLAELRDTLLPELLTGRVRAGAT